MNHVDRDLAHISHFTLLNHPKQSLMFNEINYIYIWSLWVMDSTVNCISYNFNELCVRVKHLCIAVKNTLSIPI